MLDINFIRENSKLVKKAAKDKNITCDVDALLAVDAERRKLLQKVETLRSEQNKLSKEVSTLKGDARSEGIAKSKKLAEEFKSFEPRLKEIEALYAQQILTMPSIPSPDTPIGKDEKDNVLHHEWGTVKKFKFEPQSHLDLGLALDIIDFERGAKVGGGRSYYLKGDGALLHWAVLRFAIDHIAQKGFTLMNVPWLVKEPAMIGTGYFPFGKEDAYAIEKDELFLIGTAEVALASYHMSEILPEATLPRHYAGWSPCFRREAGSYGKDTKGLYRVHQFEKVEQVVICKPEDSEAQHQFILKNAEELLQALELPYRVMSLCTGEMGAGQVKKYDIETWMPSRKAYSETHSCSNLGEFQARRLGLKYKTATGETKFVHTLNNTVVAAPRILIPIIEMYQQEDGSITIPKVLQPYMGGKTRIEKV